MNGVSRFLSRREKHHEKRGSKHLRTKVRPPFLSLAHSSEHLLRSVDGVDSQHWPYPQKWPPACFQYLYQALPAVLISLLKNGVLSLSKKPPTAELSQTYVHVSTISSSDHLTLQSQQTPTKASSELYQVFTDEEQKPADKDGEKKVCPLITLGLERKVD